LNTIAPAMVALGDRGTLAQLYGNLTGGVTSEAWPTFLAAVQALPGGVTNDDPFGGAAEPAQLAHIPSGDLFEAFDFAAQPRLGIPSIVPK
jgi:hypothetical protein